MNQSNINFFSDIQKKVYERDKLTWGEQHPFMNELIELDCYFNVCSFHLKKNTDEEKLTNKIISNLRKVESYEKYDRNFETFYII